MYRIEYWCQDTIESGRWCLTGTMPLRVAEKIVGSGVYESASICPDSEYKICKFCAHRNGKECEENRGHKIYMEDTCDKWVDNQQIQPPQTT